MMTVTQLIERLREMPPDAIVDVHSETSDPDLDVSGLVADVEYDRGMVTLLTTDSEPR